MIGTHHFDQIGKHIKNRADFLNHIKLSIEAGEVKDMRPETLGKIMDSFEIGDVMATKRDLLEGLSFAGDCGEMFRELVALCLAYVIRERLEQVRMPNIPGYRTRSVTGFRSETTYPDGSKSVRSGRSVTGSGPLPQ